MSTHYITPVGFYEGLTKINFELSSNMHPISSAEGFYSISSYMYILVTKKKCIFLKLLVYWFPPVLQALFVYGKIQIHIINKWNLFYLGSFQSSSPENL